MWNATLLPRAEKALSKMPVNLQGRITQALRKLENDPYNNSVKIQTMSDAWRIRIGDYRVIFRVDKSSRTIFILDIDHRNNIY